MKKLLLSLFAIVMAIVITGCGSSTPTEPATAGTAPSKNSDGSENAAGDGTNKRKPFDANNP